MRFNKHLLRLKGKEHKIKEIPESLQKCGVEVKLDKIISELSKYA